MGSRKKLKGAEIDRRIARVLSKEPTTSYGIARAEKTQWSSVRKRLEKLKKQGYVEEKASSKWGEGRRRRVLGLTLTGFIRFGTIQNATTNSEIASLLPIKWQKELIDRLGDKRYSDLLKYAAQETYFLEILPREREMQQLGKLARRGTVNRKDVEALQRSLSTRRQQERKLLSEAFERRFLAGLHEENMKTPIPDKELHSHAERIVQKQIEAIQSELQGWNRLLEWSRSAFNPDVKITRINRGWEERHPKWKDDNEALGSTN